jgi:hypothetical protein
VVFNFWGIHDPSMTFYDRYNHSEKQLLYVQGNVAVQKQKLQYIKWIREKVIWGCLMNGYNLVQESLYSVVVLSNYWKAL